MPSTARWPRRIVTAVAFTLTLLATAVPAQAHPYGYPQTVTIAAGATRPEVVRLTWNAGDGPGGYAHDWTFGDVPAASEASVADHDRATVWKVAASVGPLLLLATVVSLLRRQVRRRRAARNRQSS
ncbi:hypothetical protein [Micromonospora sp. NPDC048898]|uniref:hypothetical protein n=1 Tax=Micromonospora sp. NPDC048898 TaxID=3364260 RepID=UPI00371EBFA1